MSQQEEDPSHYTRTLVVKPALSQKYDQLLPKSKSLETACKTNALIRRRPVTCVYLDLGISQTVVIFSKRQALSRAVVVNSNMSRGKYLARPGSRLAEARLAVCVAHGQGNSARKGS